MEKWYIIRIDKDFYGKGLTHMDRKKQKKKQKISVRGDFIKKLLLFTLLFGILAIVITGIAIIHYATSTMPIDYNTISLNFSSVIYAVGDDGNPVELTQIHGKENRLWVDFKDIPKDLKNAFVAIEDERFYSHHGFDIPRTLKATYNYIFKHDSSFGGSTIDQQLVKNMTGDSEKSVERKVTEIIRAFYMDSKLSKDQILELYLNTIYLSQGCNGVKTAAEKYFGKDVSDLTLAECASIAGITQYPTMYDPILNPENNKKKQEVVLKKMLELGMITQEEHDSAVTETLNIQNNEVSTNKNKQSSFTDYMLEQIISDLQKETGVNESVATNMVYSGGLQIYSTMELSVQNTIEEVYDNPKKYLSAYHTDNPEQSAIVIMNPKTGAVVGMRGELGQRQGAFTLNRATDSLRQPGSSIKPLSVYAPGFEYKKFSPGSVFVDAPYKAPNGHEFRNSGNKYKGAISVKSAIAGSSNIIAVKALEKVGIQNSYNFMVSNLHFSSLTPSDKALSPLACGGLTKGVTVLEMTAGYSTFANNGVYNKPYTYTKVTDMNGNIILENKKDSSVAMSEATAYSILDCLRSVVTGGTGSGANFSSSYYIAGKTGTSDDYKDRWFMGITPYYVGGIWFGYDIPKTVSGYYDNPSVILWKTIMKEVHKDLPAKKFDSPKGMTSARICLDSGMLAGSLCEHDYRGSRAVTQHMSAGSAPTATCTAHKKVQVDKESGMVASPQCPPDLLEERIMPVFPASTRTCTVHGNGAFVNGKLPPSENETDAQHTTVLPTEEEPTQTTSENQDHTQPQQQ